MWDSFFQSLFQWLDAMGSHVNHPGVLCLLAVGALTEYVFPPFPGDTISLVGGIFYAVYDWNLGLIFAALMLGSVIGSLLSYQLGVFWNQKRSDDGTSKLDTVVRYFERYGDWFLICNRFAPGIRALFFVAAGLAKVPLKRVLFFSAVSAALWNALILSLGTLVGHNLPRLQEWFHSYSIAAWGLIVGVILVLVIRSVIRTRRKRAPRSQNNSDSSND